MAAVILAAPLLAAAMAALFGFFVIRLSGIYLAMLTLAFAQIVWSAAFQSSWTGGDNGILGVWPGGLLADKTAFYYFVLGVVLLCLLWLRRLVFSPFGYALRAARDSAVRSDAIGIDVRRQQWAAFVLAGALAGLAGVVHAYHKGSVFPNILAIPQSVDALVMVLLGGLQTLSGPIVGAAVYHSLLAEVMRSTEYWRAIVGVVIILLVVAFPQGVVGFVRTRYEAWRASRTVAGAAVERAS
jgi:branched-chain amino acid transport system permease protein